MTIQPNAVAPLGSPVPSGSGSERDPGMRRLRRFNLAMGGLHAVQALAILALSTVFALPVTASFLRMQGSGLVPAPRTLFQIAIGPAVALFLALSAAAHLAISTPRGFRSYRADLERGMNRWRWIEYAFSSSLMIVVIAIARGDLRRRVAPCAVRPQRLDDPVRLGDGGPQPDDSADELNLVLVRSVRGRGALGRDRDLPVRPGRLRRPGSPGLRVRDLRIDLRLLQHLRPEHGPAVPAHRTLAQLPVRRAHGRVAVADREVPPRMAGVRRALRPN